MKNNEYKCACCGEIDELTSTHEEMLAEYVEINGTDKGYDPNAIVCDDCFNRMNEWYSENDNAEMKSLLDEFVEEEQYEEAAILAFRLKNNK